MSHGSNDESIAQILSACKQDFEIEDSDREDEDMEVKENSSEQESDSDDGQLPKSESVSASSEDDQNIFAELEEQAIDHPKSAKEKELMSLVFGGKSQLVSSLLKQEDDTDSEEGKKRKRSAVWHDSDDDHDEDFPKKNQKSGLKATVSRRRNNFEKIVGQPKWADLDREREVDSDDEMLKTVGHVVKGSSPDLPKGEIELKRLKNLNRSTKNEGQITAVNFHPTSMVAIMTGMNGVASIVAVDGTKNEKLHTIGFQKFQIACSRLSPDGNEVVFGSFRKFYHVYNLMSGQSDTLRLKGDGAWTMKNFELSKCGKYLAVAGGFGEIHLLDARTKELLTTIQQKQRCSSLCFSPDSKYLFAHSTDNEVSIYHLRNRRFANIFTDEGCVSGSFVTVCPNNRFIATGSSHGIVNIYTIEAVLKAKYPVPEKTISNLTTSIGSIAFNVTSELLAIASSAVPNAVKLVHMKSGTVYRNFPMMKASLGHVTRVQFSPGSGYLAVGNVEGAVSLFRVKHYQNY